jgi:outer membrane protein assembly factor BamB
MIRMAIVLALAVAGQAPAPRAFLCADYGRGKVVEVSAGGMIVWEHPAPGVLDVWRRPGGNVLFNHRHGAKEVTREKKVVWEYAAAAPGEIVSCQPLPGGKVLLGECGPCRLLEVDGDGKISKEIKLSTSEKKAHYQFRLCRKSAAGTYWVAFYGESVVREIDADGNIIRQVPATNPFCAIPLPDGNVLVGSGQGHRLFEVDKDGKTVWQVEENDLPGHPLRFVAGVQRLPNGNTVVCNWGGFGYEGMQPQIFEVTRDKKVVWEVFEKEKLGTIAAVHCFDGEECPR